MFDAKLTKREEEIANRVLRAYPNMPAVQLLQAIHTTLILARPQRKEKK